MFPLKKGFVASFLFLFFVVFILSFPFVSFEHSLEEKDIVNTLKVLMEQDIDKIVVEELEIAEEMGEAELRIGERVFSYLRKREQDQRISFQNREESRNWRVIIIHNNETAESYKEAVFEGFLIGRIEIGSYHEEFRIPFGYRVWVITVL